MAKKVPTLDEIMASADAEIKERSNKTAAQEADEAHQREVEELQREIARLTQELSQLQGHNLSEEQVSKLTAIVQSRLYSDHMHNGGGELIDLDVLADMLDEYPELQRMATQVATTQQPSAPPTMPQPVVAQPSRPRTTRPRHPVGAALNRAAHRMTTIKNRWNSGEPLRGSK